MNVLLVLLADALVRQASHWARSHMRMQQQVRHCHHACMPAQQPLTRWAHAAFLAFNCSLSVLATYFALRAVDEIRAKQKEEYAPLHAAAAGVRQAPVPKGNCAAGTTGSMCCRTPCILSQTNDAWGPAWLAGSACTPAVQAEQMCWVVLLQ